MLKSVTVTNYRGDSLELPLRWPNDSGLLISNIDGITPGNVQVNSQDFAVLDGGVYNSSRMQTRNIVIEFYYGRGNMVDSDKNFDVETSRHIAYRYFPVKTKVRLDFLTDERYLSCWGYVESNDTNIFSQQEKGQVSIICPDPYFYEKNASVFNLNSFVPEFEFPFSNEGLAFKAICFSDYGLKHTYEYEYDGDIEVGIEIRILFKTIPLFNNISLYDITHRKDLILNLNDIKQSSSISFSKNGSIIINSIRGKKDIYYEYYGMRTSILKSFDVLKFPWMYLTPGSNKFIFDIYDEFVNDIDISITSNGAYGGI